MRGMHRPMVSRTVPLTIAATTLVVAAVAYTRRRRRAAAASREASRAEWLPSPQQQRDAEDDEDDEDVEVLLRRHLPFIDWDNEPDVEAEQRELMTEQLSRNEAFLGAAAQASLDGMCVTVVGLGGVGSHAAQLLARTGVGRLRLIDPSVVDAHSLRTSALATADDVGLGKATVVRDALLRTVPHCRIDVLAETLDASNARRLLCQPESPSSDYLLLCLPPSALPTTAAALATVACAPPGDSSIPQHPNGARALVCLSAEARAEPSRCGVAHQRLSLLGDACGCIEARRLSRLLRELLLPQPAPPLPAPQLLVVHHPVARDNTAAHGGYDGAPPSSGARSSTAAALAASEVAAAAPSQCSAMPALLAGMGHAAAAAVLTELAGQPLQGTQGAMSRGQREDLWKAMTRREREVFGASPSAPCDVYAEDVEFVVNEVWGRRSALSGAPLGGQQTLVLTRWERSRAAAIDNLVLLTKTEAEQHDRAEAPLARIEAAHSARFVRAVERALRLAAEESQAWR